MVEMEQHLHHNGTRIVKFFLYLSQQEWHQRFIDRLDDSDKNWKFSTADMQECHQYRAGTRRRVNQARRALASASIDERVNRQFRVAPGRAEWASDRRAIGDQGRSPITWFGALNFANRAAIWHFQRMPYFAS